MLKLVMPGSTTTAGIEITTKGVIVGRERGCDLMLCSKNVSRQHARLMLRDQVAYVEDLGSFNGTLVDGSPVTGLTALRPGNLITFGDLTFFLIDDIPLATGVTESREELASTGDVDRLSQAAVGGELKGVRRFASRGREKETESPPKSESVALSKAEATKEVFEPPIVPSGLRRTSAREVCIVLFILLLFAGFTLGRGVRHLGRLELHGERAAIENLMTPEPTPVAQSPEGEAQNTQNEPKTGTPSPEPVEASATASNQQTPVSKPTKPSSKDPLNFPESESTGEMSISDSGKALKLMKEAQRLKIDMRDEAAVFKVAKEQLGMSPEQAARVVKFVTLMAERKAIMDGGIDSIAKLNSKPRVAAPAPTSTNPLGSTSSTSREVTSLNSASAGNAPPAIAKLSSVPSDSDTPALPTAAASAGGPPSVPDAVAPTPVQRGAGFYLNFWGLVLVLGFGLSYNFREVGFRMLNFKP